MCVCVCLESAHLYGARTYTLTVCMGTGTGAAKRSAWGERSDCLVFKVRGTFLSLKPYQRANPFSKRQTLLIFLLFSIFFYVYIKSKAIEKWILKKT